MSALRECLAGETFLWRADGRQIPIKELAGSTRKVFSMASYGLIVTATTERILSQGIQPGAVGEARERTVVDPDVRPSGPYLALVVTIGRHSRG